MPEEKIKTKGTKLKGGKIMAKRKVHYLK